MKIKEFTRIKRKVELIQLARDIESRAEEFTSRLKDLASLYNFEDNESIENTVRNFNIDYSDFELYLSEIASLAKEFSSFSESVNKRLTDATSNEREVLLESILLEGNDNDNDDEL